MVGKQKAKGKIRLRHCFEYFLYRILFATSGLFKPDTASNIGGWVGRTFGYRSSFTKGADRNLRYAMPELSKQERQKILIEMWDNLGRVVFEYPHLLEICDPQKGRITFEGEDELNNALADEDRATILFAGHLGNWESISMGIAGRNIPITVIARAQSNSLVNDHINRVRQANGVTTTLKGRGAARTAAKIVKKRGVLGLLVDHRLYEGIEVKFFGRPAKTTTAHVSLALNNRARLIPVESHRTGPARFHIKFHPAIIFENSDDPKKGIIREAVQATNDLLEDWIRKRPASWTWVHGRFK